MLHGEVKINDVLIGEWTASRTGPTEVEHWYYYDCTLNYYGLEGYRFEAEWTHIHNEKHGGMALAATVIALGTNRAKRVNPSLD